MTVRLATSAEAAPYTVDIIGGDPAIAVEHAGAGSLVLCLHGIGGNRTNWRAQLRTLSSDFHMAAWDLRGYGESDDYQGPLSFDLIEGDLVRVLDRFGAASAHFVGLSLGGRISLDFARRRPERVRSLVLADTSATSAAMNSEENIKAFLDLRLRPLREGKTPRDIAPALTETLIGPEVSAEARAEITASLCALRTESYAKTLECAVRYQTFGPLEKIAQPALVITGEYDRLAPPDVARDLATRLPNARFKQINGAGHLSNIEKPELFSAAVAAFLNDVESAG